MVLFLLYGDHSNEAEQILQYFKNFSSLICGFLSDLSDLKLYVLSTTLKLSNVALRVSRICRGMTSIYFFPQSCQHNTEGPQCDKCRPGYFGDPSRGRSDDCKPCPCPYYETSRR